MAQARDWRGRWTSGGGGGFTGAGVNGRAATRQTYKGRRPKVSIAKQQSMTVNAAASSTKRRVGAPLKGNRGLRVVSTKTTTRTNRRGVTATQVKTRGRIANRRAARAINRTGKAPAGSFVVAYNPKG